MKPASVPLLNLLSGNSYALNFPAAGSVSLGNPAALRIVGDLTIEAWISVADFSAARGIFSKTSASVAAPFDFFLANGTGKPTLARGNGTLTANFVGTAAPSANAIHHIAVVMSGTTVTHYLDGVANGSGALSTTIADAGTAALIGSRTGGGTQWSGALDSVRVYNRALSATEIAQHARALYVNDIGLVGRWELVESSGATAYDWALGNNGTISGASYVAGIAPFRSSKFVHADLYTWTLIGGTISRFTSGDRDLTISGNTYLSTNALFARGKTSSTIGLKVPNLDLAIYPRPGIDLINGVEWIKAARAGNLDGASVLVERFLADSWFSTGLGKVYQFSGKVAGLGTDRASVKLKLVPPLIQLNQQVPRGTYQPTCIHTLYDSGCSLLRASFTSTKTVTSGSSVNSINIAAGGQPASGYFNLGSITFLTGALAGIQRTIDSYSNPGGTASFYVPVPLPSAPGIGDTFAVYPGCDKVFTGDCLGKFNNQANFKGVPFVPLAETAY